MELDNLLDLMKPTVELSIKKKKEIKYIYDGLIQPHEGHPIFEINLNDKEISYARYKDINTVNLLTWKEDIKNLKLMRSKDCIYLSSLNIKNLMKKLSKIDSKFISFKFTDSNINHKNTHKNRVIKLIKNEY